MDNWVYSEVTREMSPGLTSVMKFITHMGDPVVVFAICLVLFIIPYTRRKFVIPVAIAVSISAVLNFILKNIFARPRPDILRLINETDYSFPSGHAMINMALYAMIVILTIKYAKSKFTKSVVTIYCIGITFLIGLSRIYLGVHYTTDILGGWCFGLIISICVYVFWSKNGIAVNNRIKEKIQKWVKK